MDDRHIHKQIFFTLIQKRLFCYMDAIWGIGQWSPNVAAAVHYNSEQMQRIHSTDDYIGIGFWGYGINRICDGTEWYKMPDVEEIKKLPELNKHHKSYKNLMVLTFKIEGDSIYVSTFALDSVSVGVNAKVNARHYLKYFQNARIVRLDNKLHIDFYFTDLNEPISFQLDTYYVPGYFSSDDLAKYYIEGIRREAAKFQKTFETDQIGYNKEIEQDLKNRIYTTEINLRKCISDVLISATGKHEYTDILPSEIKRTIRTRIEEFLNNNPSLKVTDYSSIQKALQFSDIDHLKKLVLNEKNWVFFQTSFLDKDKVKRYFDHFSSLRNAIMHNREVTNIVSYEGRAAIEWFSAILKTHS